MVLHQMWEVIRIFRWALVVVPLTLVPSHSAPAMAAKTVVTDIRGGVQTGATRIVFELTKQVAFSAFTLNDPYRVVIDLPEVGWSLPARPLPSATGVFQRLRYGLFKPGNSRIVLDVRTPAAIAKAFILGPQGGFRYRLVIELVPTTHEAFIRGAGKTPVRVTSTQPATGLNTPGLAPPLVTAARSAIGASPTNAAGSSTSPKKMVLVKGPKPAQAAPSLGAIPGMQPPTRVQASPFRLAPRKPEPRQRGKKHVIMIDAGHGGVDPGSIGVSGVYEKHVTLSMAREIKKQFQKTGRFKVLLIRDRDVFVRLRDRIRIARDAKTELFISIHADTVKNKRIKGPAVYTLSEKASDKESAELAEQENKADLIAGVDLTHETPEVTNILIDLAQRESMNQSARFAALLIKELRRKTKVLRNTHRFAGFAVLKAPDVPSVLLEMGFLSNPTDERALRSGRYRAHLAGAVVTAVDGYFDRVEEANRK